MNMDSKTPMALYKANLELVMRIGTLLQENRQRWMKDGASNTSEAIQRTLAQTERMLTTNDWSSLSTMPGQDFWKTLQSGGGPMQGSIESAVRSQTEFAEGLKQAFAEWQQQSMAALGGSTAQPVPEIADLMRAFNAASGSGKARSEDKTSQKKEPAKKKSPAAKAKPAPARKPATKAATKPAKKSPTKKKSAASATRKPAKK